MKEDEKKVIDKAKRPGVKRREFMVGTAATMASISLTGGMSAIIGGCGKGGSDAEFDIVIKGGTIYGGTLAEPYAGDIGIKGDKIIAIGEIFGSAGRIIDATGLIVTPGFIDVHTHCDLTFERLGFKKNLAYVLPSFKGNYNYICQGVTTVVTGNCGYGYTDVNYWLKLVEKVGFGTNVYHLVPHGIIREELFGDNQPGELTKDQLEAMKKRVAQAMEMGAVGMSTGLEYAPGFHSTTEELIELSKVVSKYGGIYTTHMRDESGKIYEDGEFGVVKSVREAVRIGEEAEIPVEISHLKAAAPLNNIKAEKILNEIERARSRGLDVTADQYPYAAGSTDITILLPNRFKVTDGVKDEFKTAEGRVEIKKAINEVFAYHKPDKTLITMMYEGNEDYEGKTLAEIAEMGGKDPADLYVELVCDIKAPIGVFFDQSEEIVRDLMPNDYVMTISDGWTIPKGMTKPHPRLYGTFPRKLGRYVMEDKIMDLKSAIVSMTSQPAEKFGLKGRGKIEIGAFADLVVMDINKVMDKATYLEPHQYPEGILYSTVNGVLAVDNGIATGDRGGRGLRLS
ncbi:MAG: D-aminoacylase [Deltaproteobacteria bacterium]|uniref:D-aminoacylase n=1 Tax=Candidatus Zymogenus saltonus TaxID=2844893 RepID=A0A9D8KF25_9DELT|nr:D-aminoacylase [Candidatus Zymogenus saltonus]